MRTEDDEITRRPKFRFKVFNGSCTNKIPFGSEKSAEKARKSLLKKERGDTRIYKCGNHYHLTSLLVAPL